MVRRTRLVDASSSAASRLHSASNGHHTGFTTTIARALAIAACLAWSAPLARAATLTVAWDLEADPSVIGYVVSYGLQPGVYTATIDAGNGASQPVGGLADNTRYYFAVRAYDRLGVYSPYSSEVSGVTPTTLTPPAAPALVGPANASTGVATGVALAWTPAANATSYDLFLGTGNPPPPVASALTATSYQPAALAAGRTYYWQVVARGAGGATAGPVWSFTTAGAPSAPANPAPGDCATNVLRTIALNWAPSSLASQYDVAFGTSNPPATVAVNQAATSYQPTATLAAGTTYYWRITAKGSGGTTVGAVWSFTTMAVSAPAAALFVGTDTATQGNWKGMYGRDGYLIPADGTSAPAYGVVNQTGQLTWIWTASTTDGRALLKAASADRIASALYGTAFTIDVDIVDGQAHDVAVYVVDYDRTGRSQTLQLMDASTGAVLDARTVAAFGEGQYWTWNVRGHVTLAATAVSGNAVISGLFFDSMAAPANQPPTVALTSPAPTASFTAPATIALAATAADGDGVVARVDFYAGSTVIGTVAAPPFAGSWSNVPAGSYTLVAVATDNAGASTTSAPVAVTVTAPAPPKASATFLGTDTQTQGTWKGKYGASGYALANDASSLPAYAQVGQQGLTSWTYAATTIDVRALQKALQTGRIAAHWYGGSFSVDVNLLDGAAHQLSLYLVDWDSNKRRETIDIVDATTGAVLDSRVVSGFSGGQYLVWTVTGHVRIQVVRTGAFNAVVSAVFFGPEGG
jgi:hypothetical protein